MLALYFYLPLRDFYKTGILWTLLLQLKETARERSEWTKTAKNVIKRRTTASGVSYRHVPMFESSGNKQKNKTDLSNFKSKSPGKTSCYQIM